MNVYQVDESDEGEAILQNKLLVTLNQHGIPSDKYVYEFTFDNTFEKESKGRVNTKLVLKGEMPPGVEYIYYTRLTLFQRLRLGFRFQRLWFQKKDNIQWLVNMLIATLAIYVSWMAIVKDKNKNEIKIKLDSDQIDSLRSVLDSRNIELQNRLKMVEEKLNNIDTVTRK